jgi:hypothetical protein
MKHIASNIMEVNIPISLFTSGLKIIYAPCTNHFVEKAYDLWLSLGGMIVHICKIQCRISMSAMCILEYMFIDLN